MPAHPASPPPPARASASFAAGPATLRRAIGFWGGSAIMVGIIIGSGIFRTPPAIAQHLDSPVFILSLWVVGGVLALLGALTYAEMACMYPESGGVYVFIREGYGKAAAFIFGWTYMLITKPMAAAGIAVVFGEHLNRLLGTSIDPPLLTCAVIIALTAINARGVTLGAGVAIVLTAIKAAALVAIVILAAVLGRLSLGALEPATPSVAVVPALVPVMAAILWTYDGWSDVGAIAGEVKNPQRTLPRIYLGGALAVTVLYVLVNVAYFALVPLPEMRATDTVAPLVAERLLGAAGATIVIAIVVVSTLGSTHGSILTGARVTFAQARDGLIFRFLGAVSARGTPAVALWTQCALSCAAALWLRDFSRLADGFVFSMWIFYGLAGSAIFILRVRRPGATRPYRCWGYPIVPAVFALSAAGMTIASIAQSPRDTLPWLGVLVAGWPVYHVWSAIVRRGTPAA